MLLLVWNPSPGYLAGFFSNRLQENELLECVVGSWPGPVERIGSGSWAC